MIKKTHILQIDFFDKKKDGSPLTYVSKHNKSVKKYKKVRIKIEDGKTAWGACFTMHQEAVMRGWSPDYEVELDFKETTGADGKTYLNFELPKASSPLEGRIAELERRVAKLEESLLDAVIDHDEADEERPF